MSGNRIVLIVDDDMPQRLVLRSQLEGLGYPVVEATNGLEAVRVFEETEPHMVFMDIVMPEMDGYQAASIIKQRCGQRFVPIIFLTALTDEHQLARCIEAGGDDFLMKPVGRIVLESKIRSLERIGALHAQIHALYGQVQQEQKLAEEVFSNAVLANNVALDRIDTLHRPAALFSGDVLLTAYSPAGDLNVMLGDFTGHGLAAALGALPASEAFRAMTAKGFSADQIIRGIGGKLYALLPTSLFMAAQFVSISHDLRHITVCNCGMPDILVLGKEGEIKQRIQSAALPLGIAADANYGHLVTHLDITPGDRVLMVSDGVTDVRNPQGDYFGETGFIEALEQATAGESVVERLAEVLREFAGDAPQDDDISLAEIPCVPEILPAWSMEDSVFENRSRSAEEQAEDPGEGRLEFSLFLHGRRLAQADPVPLIINNLQEMDEIAVHRRTLFTILTELYVNALDHGVLGLDSSLKGSAEGFAHYYAERERLLSELKDGYVRIRVRVSPAAEGKDVEIFIEDSGSGFRFRPFLEDAEHSTGYAGRGIRLVRELCKSFSYEEPGNRVRAVFGLQS